MSNSKKVEDLLVESAHAGKLLEASEFSEPLEATLIRDLLCGKRSADIDPRGIQIRGAKIAGLLDLTDVRSTVSLILHSCEFDDLIVLARSHLPHLDLTGSSIPHIDATEFTCEHGAHFSTIACGQLRLTGANIEGLIDLRSAQLEATEGPALAANGLTVGKDLLLGERFRASSNSNNGVLNLVGSHIRGNLDLTGSQLDATNGPALDAYGLTVEENLYLRRGAKASSNSNEGVLYLRGATIKGQVALTGALLKAASGPALEATNITIHGDLFLNHGFTARSDSDHGTLCLIGANIAGGLILSGSTLSNFGEFGNELSVHTASIGSDLVLPIQLFISRKGPSFQVGIDGLRYPFIPRLSTCDDWIDLLKNHTPTYAAQPYQQLSSVYSAAGKEEEARRILIAQQRHLRHRGKLGGPIRKFAHAASGLFIGYGYLPGRALWFLFAVCLISAFGAVGASMLDVITHAGPQPSHSCNLAETFGVAIETDVPFLKNISGNHCEIATETFWGQVAYLASYLFQALGWSFATLFVAGYTGLVRKKS